MLVVVVISYLVCLDRQSEREMLHVSTVPCFVLYYGGLLHGTNTVLALIEYSV